MLRSQFRRHALPRVNATPHPRLGKRPFSSKPPYKPYFTLPPVRVLGPTLWCFGVAGIIYVGSAAYEVYREIQDTKRRSTPLTVKGINLPSYGRSTSGSLGGLTSAETTLAAIGALNIGIYGANRLIPATWSTFSHIPAGTQNFTMFSSMFGHSGLLHLGFNMYGLFNFGPAVARSPTFNSSGSHMTAFYLCSGLFASLGHHLSTAWPNKIQRLASGLGASGAIMALIGAFGMSYPNAGIGIILIPGSLPAQDALMALAAFEIWGTFIGYSFISVAHAAHLTGLGIGVAYVYFDGGNTLWKPTKRFAFNSMKRLNVV